jgi:outer membrane biosynthesis protein TonB
MQERNTRKNLTALGTTIGVHALLLVALLFAGFSAPPPPPDQDLGMEVNLGTSDDGMGDEQPLNPNPPSNAAPAASTPQNEPAPSQDAASTQDIATQDDEEAPEITKPEKPVETPKEQPKNLEPKPVRTPKKNTEAPPAPVPPAPKPKAVYSGGTANSANSGNNANGANNSTGEGNTGRPGDRGQINGDPNASGYTGGGLGGGRSDFRLRGRSLVSRPQPTYEGNETGYIAVNIKVDRQGNVVSAAHSLRGSTLNNPTLIEIAKRAAREIKYNASPDAPEEQFGTIRFYFKVQ